MAGNRAVAYKEPGVVEVIDTDYPTSGGATRPSVTGPGLPGGGFSC